MPSNEFPIVVTLWDMIPDEEWQFVTTGFKPREHFLRMLEHSGREAIHAGRTLAMQPGNGIGPDTKRSNKRRTSLPPPGPQGGGTAGDFSSWQWQPPFSQTAPPYVTSVPVAIPFPPSFQPSPLPCPYACCAGPYPMNDERQGAKPSDGSGERARTATGSATRPDQVPWKTMAGRTESLPQNQPLSMMLSQERSVSPKTAMLGNAAQVAAGQKGQNVSHEHRVPLDGSCRYRGPTGTDHTFEDLGLAGHSMPVLPFQSIRVSELAKSKEARGHLTDGAILLETLTECCPSDAPDILELMDFVQPALHPKTSVKGTCQEAPRRTRPGNAGPRQQTGSGPRHHQVHPSAAPSPPSGDGNDCGAFDLAMYPALEHLTFI
jgi:hypothetical protein